MPNSQMRAIEDMLNKNKNTNYNIYSWQFNGILVHKTKYKNDDVVNEESKWVTFSSRMTNTEIANEIRRTFKR